ncbi:MAG: cytidine deaminase [Clostridia bacterium]|nr:cytidine deaminase [Clostridia bacterium]
MTDIELIDFAIKAKQNAHVPYSNFKVGAALLAKSGKVYTGCNVECSSYGISLCAERTALVKAVSEGEKEFQAIAVVGGKDNELNYTTPCGACRQFLSDFGDFKVIIGYKENDELKSKIFTVKELLPESFEL